MTQYTYEIVDKYIGQYDPFLDIEIIEVKGFKNGIRKNLLRMRSSLTHEEIIEKIKFDIENDDGGQ